MRSMTGYGRAEVVHAGRKFSVELNSVNRKQSDIVINLPRDLGELEPRIRQTINENISRGRTNATIALHSGPNGARNLALDTELARSYHEAMRALQKEDRKSTRLNSSHVSIAYAVFCLNKKKDLCVATLCI